MAVAVLGWQRPWAEKRDAPVAADIPSNPRALLTQTFRDLTEADTRAEFAAAAGHSEDAKSFADAVWSARSRLGVTDVRLVYEQGGDAVDRADGTTSAQVKVTWVPSADSVFAGSRPAASDVRIRLRPRPNGFDVISAGGSGRDRLPLWLAGPVQIHQDDTTATISVGSLRACAGVPARARAAMRAVRELHAESSSRLIVVCPDRTATTAALLGRPAGAVAQIAAISTALDGPQGSPAIVLNPALYRDMDARARQVIMSHEATHILTGAIGTKVDLWVAEGYADFVALRNDREPLAVSAGQILAQVRSSGAPKKLPAEADFAEASHGLGAAYESAWMAFRMLADQFGEPAVTSFYRDVVAGVPVAEASARQFGWTIAELTSAWRAYLTKSASTVS